MCLLHKGLITISPRLIELIKPYNTKIDTFTYVQENNLILDIRMVFFHNSKIEFKDNPIERIPGYLEQVEYLLKKYFDTSERNNVLISTSNIQLWKVVLFQYIVKKILKK